VQYLRPLNNVLTVPLAVIGLESPRGFKVLQFKDGSKTVGRCEWINI